MNEITSHRNEADTQAEERLDVRMLRSRAVSLKAQAKALPEPLATTYRRRARELALKAFLIDNATLVRAS